jgi:hypothetical protein
MQKARPSAGLCVFGGADTRRWSAIASRRNACFVLAGLVPAIHAFDFGRLLRRRCPAQGPGMTIQLKAINR